MGLPDSLKPREHTLIDYGEDEFTQGRLHPMIDLTLRCDRILEEAEDPEVGVILLDLVLGYGCNEDPAGPLAEAVRAARAKVGDRVAFVASVCGVDSDPQNGTEQARKLAGAGVEMCGSNAEAARLAAALLS
jgi:FdrA protein